MGLLLFWPLSWLPFGWQVGVTVAAFALGTLAASEVAAQVGLEDPGIVVVDEVVGMWISLLLLPFTPTIAALGLPPLPSHGRAEAVAGPRFRALSGRAGGS